MKHSNQENITFISAFKCFPHADFTSFLSERSLLRYTISAILIMGGKLNHNIFIAHSTDGDRSEWQSILSHSTGTASLALKLGLGTGVEAYACAA